MRTASDYRAMWDTIENLWSQTVARAGRLPRPARHQRVDDEWSFVETLRHLVLATDKWAGHMILGNPVPYHRLGLPSTATSAADAVALGIDLGADPSLAEVLEVRGTRMAMVRGITGCPHFTHSPLHWTRDYIKFCAPAQASLEEWASTLGDVKHCRTCFRKPTTGSNRDATRG